jgi:hypothetical protein
VDTIVGDQSLVAWLNAATYAIEADSRAGYPGVHAERLCLD